MTRSQAQIEASRRNGAKSLGPITEEGKARSSRNNTRHGLFSREVVLNNESLEDYQALLNEVLDHYQPANAPERLLVHEFVSSVWRLNRILLVQDAGIDHEVDQRRNELDARATRMDEATRTFLAIENLTKANPTLTWYSRQEARLRRSVRDARNQLDKLRAARLSAAESKEP